MYDSSPNIWMSHIIEEILKNLTYQQIFELRTVNSMWHSICVKLINKGCFTILKKFHYAFKHLEQINKECQFSDEKRYPTTDYQHLFHLTWSNLELIQSEFELTTTCVRRYYTNHQNLCVFDYKLLDHTVWLISRVYKYPWRELSKDLTLVEPALDRYHVDEFRTLCKTCQIRFHYYIEKPLNENVSVSGAKIIDILDTLLERPSCAVKTVHLQEYDPGTKLISYKATYTLQNAWFSSTPLHPPTDIPDTFNAIQYFHYIRLVRLVRYHNRFTLEIIHKDRMGRSEFWDDITSPNGITFTGQGENNGFYYHYGCLNDKMKLIKFRDRNPDIRLELCVNLTSSYLLSSVCLQQYLRSNHRDLDYEMRQLLMRLDVVNTFSLHSQSPEQWSIEIS
ncbi:hypothetical protein M8J76_003322 [Diaphorina citri]|jgi:hypothetical protein|nr:hypothetical protein M8J75_010550 [Diaphorina citri]KAI5713672.1 hypothetical protein M8J76_003322 [Diaphorina citri]KAI5714652.1 hypothetical protein M8J77_003214 [Diaphorina citri]